MAETGRNLRNSGHNCVMGGARRIAGCVGRKMACIIAGAFLSRCRHRLDCAFEALASLDGNRTVQGAVMPRIVLSVLYE